MGDKIAVFKYWKGCHLEEVELFSTVPGRIIKISGLKLQRSRLSLTSGETSSLCQLLASRTDCHMKFPFFVILQTTLKLGKVHSTSFCFG